VDALEGVPGERQLVGGHLQDDVAHAPARVAVVGRVECAVAEDAGHHGQQDVDATEADLPHLQLRAGRGGPRWVWLGRMLLMLGRQTLLILLNLGRQVLVRAGVPDLLAVDPRDDEHLAALTDALHPVLAQLVHGGGDVHVAEDALDVVLLGLGHPLVQVHERRAAAEGRQTQGGEADAKDRLAHAGDALADGVRPGPPLAGALVAHPGQHVLQGVSRQEEADEFLHAAVQAAHRRATCQP